MSCHLSYENWSCVQSTTHFYTQPFVCQSLSSFVYFHNHLFLIDALHLIVKIDNYHDVALELISPSQCRQQLVYAEEGWFFFKIKKEKENSNARSSEFHTNIESRHYATEIKTVQSKHTSRLSSFLSLDIMEYFGSWAGDGPNLLIITLHI